MKTLFILMAICLVAATQAYSKAAFLGEVDLVTKATAIAIVELGEPTASKQKGAIWTYLQTAKAKVVQRFKGDLPDTFTLHGGETFDCAQCRLSGGRYLVFLSRDGDLWVGTNYHLSLRPVKEDQIEWYLEPEQGGALKVQPAQMVIQRVRAILAKAAKT